MISLSKKILIGLTFAFVSTMVSAAPCAVTDVTADGNNANACADHSGNDENYDPLNMFLPGTGYENYINDDFSLSLNWSFIDSPEPGGTTGTWNLSAYTISNPFVIVLKAGPNFAAYLFNIGATSVDWDTINLPTNGNNPINLSHISLYTSTGGPGEVPLPAAVWLFGSALMGLVGIRKRYTA